MEKLILNEKELTSDEKKELSIKQQAGMRTRNKSRKIVKRIKRRTKKNIKI